MKSRLMKKRRKKQNRRITGHLDALSLSEILQMLSLGGKTACVTLSDGERKGHIWFEGGAAVHAETGDMVGHNAFYTMVGWTCCDFSIEVGVRCSLTSLTEDTMLLTLEGLRLVDEAMQFDQPKIGNGRPTDHVGCV